MSDPGALGLEYPYIPGITLADVIHETVEATVGRVGAADVIREGQRDQEEHGGGVLQEEVVDDITKCHLALVEVAG
jgi:hypothetical protein